MKNIIKILCIIVALQCIFSCNTKHKSISINGLYKIDSKENNMTKEDIDKTDPLALVVMLSLDSTQLKSIFPTYCYINDSTLSFLGNNNEDRISKYTSFAKNDSVINIITSEKDTIIFNNGKDKFLSIHSFKLHLKRIAN